jgi:hypothetical protein
LKFGLHAYKHTPAPPPKKDITHKAVSEPWWFWGRKSR